MGVDLPCLAVRLRWPLDDVSFLSFLLPSVFQIPLLIFWSGVSFSFRPTLPFLSFILPFRIRQRNILWRTCSSPHVLPMSFGSAVVHVWGLGASEREGNGRGLGRLALERKVRGSRRGKEAASSTMGRRDRECWRWMVVGGTLRSMTNSVNGKVGQQQIRSTASSVPAISTFGQRRVRSRPSARSVNGEFGPGHQQIRSTASSVPAISTSGQRRVRSRPSARPVNGEFGPGHQHVRSTHETNSLPLETTEHRTMACTADTRDGPAQSAVWARIECVQASDSRSPASVSHPASHLLKQP